METDKKLYVALVVLAALGGAVYLNNQKQATEAAAHSVSGAKAELPTLKLSADAIKEIDKVVIKKPADGDGGAPEEFTLVKKGEEDWELEQPLTAKANASNVKSLLDSLERLEVKEQISPSAESYEKWGVTDAKALHATLYKGEEVKFDAYFGEDGSRGQMTRVAGTDGVYAIKGYSKFTFARDMKGWRDKTIFKFEDKDAVKVTVENENGTFSFEKEGDKWSGKHTGTEKGDKAKDIDGFK